MKFTSFSLIGADPSCESSPCIGVDIYYESRCRDTINFFANQLQPTYQAFNNHLNFNFIPFGKASHTRNENGTLAFTCQHGDREYKGNKLQACALNTIEETMSSESKQEYFVKFILCTLSNTYFSRYGIGSSQCANYIGLSELAQQSITHCIESSIGDDLLAVHGDKTHSLQPPLRFVPTIIINGVYSDEHQNAARRNFTGLIADLLREGGEDLTSSA